MNHPEINLSHKYDDPNEFISGANSVMDRNSLVLMLFTCLTSQEPKYRLCTAGSITRSTGSTEIKESKKQKETRDVPKPSVCW